ncbi:hypothetical protein HPB49_008205 [Dermacentor silvarum]|uniref:Uncharacterized protein n=1 Tax=Dermacentor silvarum TaxID=543639 RepID=A0ACB8DBN5_DERSI|nr:hypothetical protein HPB49_008205 [Dermacentor silvarum]
MGPPLVLPQKSSSTDSMHLVKKFYTPRCLDRPPRKLSLSLARLYPSKCDITAVKYAANHTDQRHMSAASAAK